MRPGSVDPMAELHCIVNNQREWVNIQEPIRVCFGHISSQLLQQEQQIKSLLSGLAQKADLEFVKSELQQKGDRSTIQNTADEIWKVLGSKADFDKVEKLEGSTVKINDFLGYKQKIDELMNLHDIGQKVNTLNTKVEDLHTQTHKLEQQAKDNFEQSQNDIVHFAKILEEIQAKLGETQIVLSK